MKVYRLFYDKEILNHDKDGIEALYWYNINTIQKMIKKDKSKFKGDVPVVLDWYTKNFI